ncbi:mechanosensitive ion channel protein [Pseudoalteromonas rubra]|uniref:Small-conductance mechanosensitive channel n=1 Tax=Pseudoalteromonas rubra TaxID=43658 RepID=A0A5S3WLI9_9GAMM|nr:mechanosensitive ion channel family protein [Pseudoalteromonas rubra]TMP28390.1 mechanosensitive ion channel protein [Pseudoalteromonas rubra]TMP37207.1 mechanosensitive ion channel protein [Pseudoalteromonas rubra]
MSFTFTPQDFWSLINEKLVHWAELTIKNLPNLVIATLILIVFVILSKFLARWLLTLLKRLFESNQIAGLITGICRMILVAIGFFFALDIMGLSKAVASLLAGAGIIGLAIGFAFQDMTENMIAGVVMGIRKPFRVGDVVEAGDTFGTVRRINLRNTLIENFYGQLAIVPNKILFKNELINYSRLATRRIEIEVGISYADDIEQAESVIVEAINELDGVIKQHETDVYACGFGDSSVNLLVWFWIDYPGEIGFMQMRHKAIIAIHKTLEENDILIPFPIRTLDFNAKGGANLGDMQINMRQRAHTQQGEKEVPSSEA